MGFRCWGSESWTLVRNYRSIGTAVDVDIVCLQALLNDSGLFDFSCGFVEAVEALRPQPSAQGLE